MPSESPFRGRRTPGYALIETFRREAGGTFPRLDLHLARLEKSARELGFASERADVESRLRRLATETGTLRMRLELSQDGRIDVTAVPFSPLPEETVWRIMVARTRLDANDPLRRYKTTQRDIYATARSEYPTDLIDEVLMLNKDGELAEGTITNIFVDAGDGVLLTPPVSSGSLPGILRGELLDTGRAVERRLTLDDLPGTRAIFVGNSLRGLIRARLEPVR